MILFAFLVANVGRAQEDGEAIHLILSPCTHNINPHATQPAIDSRIFLEGT